MALRHSPDTIWSAYFLSLTSPQRRNTLSSLGDRSFPSLGCRISSLATPRRRPLPAHVSSAGRLAIRRPALRPFLWPTWRDSDLCRYGHISCSCGRHGVALAGRARSFNPGTTRFVSARLGMTAVTSGRGCIRPSRSGPVSQSKSWVMFSAILLTSSPSPRRSLVPSPRCLSRFRPRKVARLSLPGPDQPYFGQGS